MSELARLARLLDASMELPPAEQAAFLAALPAEDAPLRERLAQMLAEHAQDQQAERTGTRPPELLDRLAAVAQLAARQQIARGEAQEAAAPGQRRIGPYSLLRRLGQGGMGEVWLAERADGTLQRSVALKLPWLPPGALLATGEPATRSADPQRLAHRFERERDILAALEHPHIARLYDAGVSEQGQPWLALEYVDGEPLTAWCEHHQLSVRARIELFLQVLQAVQHAHAQLVVHRDLKPSNIFVNREGQVRLLDFGIATLLADEAEPGHGPATEWQHAPMTPDYASPEQIAGEPLGTASDIYALGVVLCELLSGQRPYKLTRRTRGALEEAILHAEPQRPSKLAGAERPALQRQLRGDLDTIALKALNKKPAERYASAEAFEQDLRRWLRHEPVHAHPAHWPYRARKFVQRHTLPVAAAVLTTAGLATGLAVALHQAELARREAQRTQAVQDFLVGLFNEADPARAQGRELAARDLLARGERELQQRLAGEPDLAAQLGRVLVTLYRKLGDGVRALPLARAQVAWAAQHEGERSLSHGDALATLAQVENTLGHHEQALVHLAKADAAYAGHGAARAQARLAVAMSRAENLHALQHTEEALALTRATLPQLVPGSWEALRGQLQLATQLSSLNQAEEARRALQGVMPLLGREWPEHGIEAAEMRADVGYALWQLRDFGPAAEMLRQAITELDRLAGPRNGGAIQTGRTLGMLHLEAGEFAQADRVLADNVRRAREFYGNADGETALNLSFRVLALNRTGQGELSEAVARESWGLLRDRATTLSASEQRGVHRRLGAALIASGHPAAALVELQAIAEEERAAPPLDSRHAATLYIMACALNLLGRPAEALGQAQGSATIFGQAQTPAARVGLAKARLNEALALIGLQRLAEAPARIEEAERLFATTLPAGHADLQLPVWVRAALLQASGQPDAATALDAEARRAYQAASGGTLPAALYVF